MRFSHSLQFRISWVYTLISVVTIGIIGAVLYIGISRVVLDESVRSSQMAISKSGTLVEMYIDRLKVLSTLLSHNPRTIQALTSPTQDGDRDVLQFIDSVLSSDASIKSVIVVSKDGYVLSNEKNLNMQRSSDMMTEPWYVAAINSNMPALTSARMQRFSMNKNDWVISMSQEIKDTDGNNLGVVLLDIEYQGIEDYLNDLELGRDGFAFIINSKGGIVYHKDPSYFTDAAKQAQIRSIAQSQEGFIPVSNELIYKTKLQNTDWTLVGVNSLDGLQQIRNQLLRSFVIVGLGLLLLIIAAAPFLAKGITRPIHRLEQAMSKMKSGSLEVSVAKTGVTEIQGLAQHFNEMVLEVRRLMQEVETKEKALRGYELSVLHSQINPHFLYNTLDTIVWMAEFNESDRVITTTKALAKFFQLSLSGGSETTTIANEMNHVSQYLFIQKERYGDKLQYLMDWDPALSDKVIPKIILQPLVENAIYHGIREKEGPGLIEIGCSRTNDGNVMFVVKDDGVGFDPELRRHSGRNGQPTTLPKLGGVGINNVDDRLKLYYGRKYGVKIESRPGEGTTAMIVIP
ncbi:cache domain-containing protein [Paenibacillus sp. TAB 01]|uniref:cache domain-containing protein n=1 Tax=Paenibacillus sp. TAB 01 TaxID=3368988 RepID=UPI003751EDF9